MINYNIQMIKKNKFYSYQKKNDNLVNILINI